ncbi:hypothetical protein 2A_00053 [Ralstonia phage Darius]|uniref:Uncharacterized protein n=1 Tax=Ralstonia phage Darius TaxID=2759722 RepID=A0A7G5B932_9CAUD|nr:hypothetical protein 2A_00053 [Ralstonia phage Darius]
MIEHTGPETLVGPFPFDVPPARPVGFIEQWELDQLKNGCVARVFPTKDEPHDVAVFTHPEASTGLRVFFDKEELDALYEAIEWAKDEGLPGTAEHLQAIFDAHSPEASAPGLSFTDGLNAALEALNGEALGDPTGEPDDVAYARAVNDCREAVKKLLTRASAATVCAACEGSPSAENNPCAVCGRAATVGEASVADDDVFTWLETEISAVDCRYRGDPSYDHDAYWMRERVLKLVKEAKDVFGKVAQQQAEPGAEQ